MRIANTNRQQYQKLKHVLAANEMFKNSLVALNWFPIRSSVYYVFFNFDFHLTENALPFSYISYFFRRVKKKKIAHNKWDSIYSFLKEVHFQIGIDKWNTCNQEMRIAHCKIKIVEWIYLLLIADDICHKKTKPRKNCVYKSTKCGFHFVSWKCIASEKCAYKPSKRTQRSTKLYKNGKK